jgi:FKBP-type peptidyl-prolyl cis-trans isomerase
MVMGKKFIYSLLFLLAVLSGCKENNWAEWKVENELWLQNNALQDSVHVTSSGLQYKIIADPTPYDACPNVNSTIICDYKLKLINGNQIDAGNSVTLKLSSTISGFAEGCHKVHTNGDIMLYIPAYLGYDQLKFESNEYKDAEGFGTEGTQSYIPPYSTLIYEIHICGVTD